MGWDVSLLPPQRSGCNPSSFTLFRENLKITLSLSSELERFRSLKFQDKYGFKQPRPNQAQRSEVVSEHICRGAGEAMERSAQITENMSLTCSLALR